MVARLDDRIANSAIRDGWIERAHFTDATASLYIDGELVHLEDLVLHDAHMDIRSPTHELVIAHAVLRARRQIFGNDPDWALSNRGLAALRGRELAPSETADTLPAAPERKDAGRLSFAGQKNSDDEASDGYDDRFGDEFAAIDAVLARSQAALDGAATLPRRMERDKAIYDESWDEEARLAEWHRAGRDSQDLPPVLRAAVLLDAWTELDVLQHSPWLGRLLVAATLRQSGTTAAHLLAINAGLRDIRWERRRARDRKTRLVAVLEAIELAGKIGLKEHERLMAARQQFERKLAGRRSNSRLPQLIDLVLSHPLVSAGMIAKELKVTPQGAVGLADELGLREMTGRGRYRAWGTL
jgi:hypothetical protein